MNPQEYLESLTPGGSEFHNDPKACYEFIRKRLAFVAKREAKWKKANGKLGMKVNLVLGGNYQGTKVTLRNVTEVHFNCSNMNVHKTAFESDIHNTGVIYPSEVIDEFEVFPESELAKAF